MIKKLILSLCGIAMLGFSSKEKQRQRCATDEFYREQVALHPEIKIDEARLKADIDRYVYGRIAATAINPLAKGANLDSDAAQTWPNDVTEYHIPIVFHIIYDNAIGTPQGTSAALVVSDND